MRKPGEATPVLPNALRTRTVALDTEVIRGQNFHYASRELEPLADLAASDRVRFVLTDVVDREVRRQIKRRVLDAQRAMQSRELWKEASILSNVPEYRNAFRVSPDEVGATLLGQYEEFLTRTKATVVPTGHVTSERVMALYFDAKPPFGPSEAKRHEFPDAVSLLGLHDWAVASDEYVYVVSADALTRMACDGERLIPLAELRTFLDRVARVDHPFAANAVSSWLLANWGMVEPTVHEEVASLFSSRWAWVEDEVADVNDFAVDKVTPGTPTFVELDDESATVVLDAVVDFTAHVAYDDPNLTYYDEGERYVFNRIETEIDGTSAVTITMRFLLPDEPNEEPQLDEVTTALAGKIKLQLYPPTKDT